MNKNLDNKELNINMKDSNDINYINNWDGFKLHKDIMCNLNKLNFHKPTSIQNKVLDYNTSKVDLVIQARTGEGKTLCFGIPIVDYILKQYDNAYGLSKTMSPVALILTPTRELGVQIKKHIESILIDHKKTEEVVKKANKINSINKKINYTQYYQKIRIANIMGGFAKVKQLKQLSKNPEIIVATPGRLWEIIESEDIFINFKNLRFFVIDEADRMMEKNHFRELKSIVKYIYDIKERQIAINPEKNKMIKEKIKDIGNNNNNNDNNNNDNEYKHERNTTNQKDDNEDIGSNKVLTTNDNLNEDDFIKKLLKDKGIDNPDIEEVDMANLIDNINEEIFDDSGFLKSKSKKRRDRQKKGEEHNIQNNTSDNNEKKLNYLEEEKEENDKSVNNSCISDEEETSSVINDEDAYNYNESTLDNKFSNKMKGEVDYNKTMVKNKGKFASNIKTDINLRTILCSATIEIKSKEKVNKSKSKQRQDYNNNIKSNKSKNNNNNNNKSSEQQALDNLIKNLKFYNKLVYIKLDNKVKFTDDNIPDLASSAILPSKLELEAFKCEASNKDYYLYYLLSTNKDKSIIVFTNSISHTKKLFSIFSYFDFNIKCLHSKMQQRQRISKLDKFRNNAKNKDTNLNLNNYDTTENSVNIMKDNSLTKGNVLICTDVGARGLDIPEVDLVIHYHIPNNAENFVHRSGRTARVNKSGKCVSLVSDKELNQYKSILREIKIYEITLKSMPISNLDKYKSLFNTVKEVEKTSFLSKKNLRDNEWLRKQANKCDLLLDDNLEEEIKYKEGNNNLLGKKRIKKNNKKVLNYIENKKLQQKVVNYDISKSSFLNPNSIKQLNEMLKNEKLKDVNLSDLLRNAHNDLDNNKRSKSRKKTRHVKRRLGK